jgi:hypothetical protein
VGAWLRMGMRFQNRSDPKKLNDQYFDTVYGEFHASGKVHEKVGFTLNFNADILATIDPAAPPGPGPKVGLMDAIIELDFLDEVHLWSGQLLVPVDRTNFSGPFFISPWLYPGFFTIPGAPATLPTAAAPREGPYGRNVGSVLWGDFQKGLVKYYASIMNLSDGAQRPLFSGRVNFAPIGGEPGYYSSSTYYGDKDVLAFGLGAQYQKDGSGGIDDYTGVNADVLAEFKLGDSGVITGEGAYYHFAGDAEAYEDMFFVLGSYLSPPVGPGMLQPMVRYQQAMGDNDLKATQIDAHLAYVVKGAQMRGLVGFTNVKIEGADGFEIKGNAVQLALQTILF